MFLSTYTLAESEYTQFRQRARYMLYPPVHHADKISDEHRKTKAAPFVRKERLLFVADDAQEPKERQATSKGRIRPDASRACNHKRRDHRVPLRCGGAGCT